MEWVKCKTKQPKNHGYYITFRPNAPIGNKIATIKWDSYQKMWGGAFGVTYWGTLPKEPCERASMRFYIDERSGCIAVRDREKDDEWSPGLHPDMVGVIAYWSGYKGVDENGHCCWYIYDWQREKAENLCAELNKY